jgi:CubicO group peptidase (beta-lactamase class C family)
MSTRSRPILAALLTIAALPAADLDQKIHRVTNGLRPPSTPKGQPGSQWSLADRMQYYKVPGVTMAVMQDGKVEWARGFGVTSAEGGKPVDADTMFQAASISKHVGAIVALRLVDEGNLSLDEDVNLKLRSWRVPENEFTRTEKVTLRRLLNHSAGLTVHGFPGYAAGAPLPRLPEILDGKKPANTPAVRVDVVPGTLWRYSGGGYEVMQQLVVDVTGKSFPQVAREIVLGPLQMTRSTYEQPLPPKFEGNAARTHPTAR